MAPPPCVKPEPTPDQDACSDDGRNGQTRVKARARSKPGLWHLNNTRNVSRTRLVRARPEPRPERRAARGGRLAGTAARRFPKGGRNRPEKEKEYEHVSGEARRGYHLG